LFNQVLADCIENHKDILINSPTAEGPLWGRGRSGAVDEMAEIEARVLGEWKDWCYALEHAGLTQQRRSLLINPEDFASQWILPGTLQLKFCLPVGSYATALLREIAELSRPHKP
jgi:tRNA pseudouridine13 synthase